MAYIAKKDPKDREDRHDRKHGVRPAFGASRSVKPSYPPRKMSASRAYTGVKPLKTSTNPRTTDFRSASAIPAPFPQKPAFRPSSRPSKPGAFAAAKPPFVRAVRPMAADTRGTFKPGYASDTDTKRSYEKSAASTFPVKRAFKAQKPPRTVRASYASTPTESWNAVATWYDDHLDKDDTYHKSVILPNLTRLLAPKRGETIVDIACGTGFFAGAFAKEGATMTGIDVGEELIAIARKNSTMVSYHVGSAEKIDIISDNAKDKALIVLAIQNIEHAQKVFNEAFRILKKGGSFHVVMNHPAYRIPKQSAWEFDAKQNLQFRRVDSYLSESRSEIDIHPGITGSAKTVSFHRPLQYYFKALAKAGFVVEKLEEWTSMKVSDSGPRAKAENDARKEFPLFLYLGAKKFLFVD